MVALLLHLHMPLSSSFHAAEELDPAPLLVIYIYVSLVTIFVRPSDELPIYRQIIRQVIEAISIGSLSAGSKLASHRDLAEELVIAPLTVKKAYDELERQGYIETQRGRGTFVSEKLPVRRAGVVKR